MIYTTSNLIRKTQHTTSGDRNELPRSRYNALFRVLVICQTRIRSGGNHPAFRTAARADKTHAGYLPSPDIAAKEGELSMDFFFSIDTRR
jgi:hypothetical protein